ncbi:MAG: DUF2922 domain-containing protein [Clostridia bacterium]|nr:DUF2922 domain-containing protein [Clostridia bacterium]
MTKRLVLSFQNAAGRRTSISLPNAKDGLTAAEVQQAMQAIIAKNVFASTGGDLVAIAGARIVAQEVTELEVAS